MKKFFNLKVLVASFVLGLILSTLMTSITSFGHMQLECIDGSTTPNCATDNYFRGGFPFRGTYQDGIIVMISRSFAGIANWLFWSTFLYAIIYFLVLTWKIDIVDPYTKHH